MGRSSHSGPRIWNVGVFLRKTAPAVPPPAKRRTGGFPRTHNEFHLVRKQHDEGRRGMARVPVGVPAKMRSPDEGRFNSRRTARLGGCASPECVEGRSSHSGPRIWKMRATFSERLPALCPRYEGEGHPQADLAVLASRERSPVSICEFDLIRNPQLATPPAVFSSIGLRDRRRERQCEHPTLGEIWNERTSHRHRTGRLDAGRLVSDWAFSFFDCWLACRPNIVSLKPFRSVQNVPSPA